MSSQSQLFLTCLALRDGAWYWGPPTGQLDHLRLCPLKELSIILTGIQLQCNNENRSFLLTEQLSMRFTRMYFLASILTSTESKCTSKMFLITCCCYCLCFQEMLCNSAFKWVYLSFSPLPFASLLFTAICKASSDSKFAFLHLFFFVDGLDS